jgi:ATP-dependent exoDNAse (exonuclease V) beta subunit
MMAEERRLLYVAATRAKDRLFLVDGGKGSGSTLRDALREGIEGATAAGEGRCLVTGLRGERLRLRDGPPDGSAGGELLRVAVASALPVEERKLPPRLPVTANFGDRFATVAEPAPPAPTSGPVSLAELYDRTRGKRFGEMVHRVLEAYPPVTDPWPPPGAVLPAAWNGEEERRWNAVVAAVRSSPLSREIRSCRVVGTELPLLRIRDGAADEARADLVVRLPGPEGELRVIDYKTGERDLSLEEAYFLQLRKYCDILSAAWGVPVRGILWYVESGASFKAT